MSLWTNEELSVITDELKNEENKMKENDYKELLPKSMELVPLKFCYLNPWEFALIHVEIDGILETIIIEKYQNFFASIRWKTIFSKNYENATDEEKLEITKLIYKKYPNILLNESVYDEFVKNWKLNDNSYKYYKNNCNQEVEYIKSDIEWLDLSKQLKIE